MSDVVVSLKPLPKGIPFARFLHCLVEGDYGRNLARSLSFAELYRDTPHVKATFELSLKADVPPGVTGNPAWAGALVASGVADEVLQVLSGLSIVARLEPKLFRVDFNATVPADITSDPIGGGPVPEGAPTPAAALSLTSLGPLAPTKFGVLYALTRELLVLTSTTNQQMVARAVLRHLAKSIDTQFLLPTATGEPAPITAGAVAIPSTGSTAAAISADLGAMLAAITTGGSGLTWIMRTTTMAHLAGALGSPSGLPDRLWGLPVVHSPNSPAQITLVDAAAILYADEGGFDVNVSRDATVQLNTTPDNPPTAATAFESMWQNNHVSVRSRRWINWLRAVDGAVSYMTVSY